MRLTSQQTCMFKVCQNQSKEILIHKKSEVSVQDLARSLPLSWWTNLSIHPMSPMFLTNIHHRQVLLLSICKTSLSSILTRWLAIGTSLESLNNSRLLHLRRFQRPHHLVVRSVTNSKLSIYSKTSIAHRKLNLRMKEWPSFQRSPNNNRLLSNLFHSRIIIIIKNSLEHCSDRFVHA